MQEIPAPKDPESLQETGLEEGFLLDLSLKHAYVAGTLAGMELAQRLGLGFHIVSELIKKLKELEFVAAQGGSGAFGGVWTRWTVTRKGAERAQEVLARDNYRGPAPVPFAQYQEQLKHQSLKGFRVTPEAVRTAFSRLVLHPEVVDRIGPAIHSGRSLFLYGPPGNGKTALSECIADTFQGGVFVPHALYIESEIVIVFDEVFHRRLERQDSRYDKRWVWCRRPSVVVGGELTLDMLDLSVSGIATYYKAPFQVKANSGVLFIDDFGRQRCDPQQLLNRWIVPLDSQFDYLTFQSGQKARVPFDCLVVFSTNLNPRDLADDAFLRRIRYKIPIHYPSPAMYKAIFQRVCQAQGVPYDDAVVDYLLQKHYVTARRPMRACEPRDLVEQLVDLHRFHNATPRLSREAMDHLVALYFVSTETVS